MRTFTQNEPLTDAELDRLGDFLESCKGGRAMSVEQLDGLSGTALRRGPSVPTRGALRRRFRGVVPAFGSDIIIVWICHQSEEAY
jgi:hypothetical protein